MTIRGRFILSLLIFGAAGGCAQSKSGPDFTAHYTLQDLAAARRHDWANEPWSGNNKPYQQVRSDMERALASGQDMESLRIKYGLLAQQHPDNPVAQLQWAYAASMSITHKTDGGKAQGKMYGVAEALAHVRSPRAYDYARERFLIEVWFDRTNGLENLGERLLAHSPADYNVQYDYIRVLNWSPRPNARQKAIAQAEQLIGRYPHKPSPYTLLAGIYTERWWNTHDKGDANKALAYFQKYLQLAPPAYTHREDVKRVMASIRKEMAAQ